MRRFPITLFVVIMAIIAVVGGWKIYADEEKSRYAAVDAIRNSYSYLKVSMLVKYPTGPISTETITLVDDNGHSLATYAVGNRSGTVATFHEKIEGFDVSFAIGRLVQDGIWQLTNKGPRKENDPTYTVHIQQTVTGQSGQRTITFSDPEFWANAREFRITLDPKKPTPSEMDLVKMQATAIADPRYLQVVKDFHAFGSPAFKKTIAKARNQILKS
jgi:hypothetical protein